MKQFPSPASEPTNKAACETQRTRFITGMVCTRAGVYIFESYADHATDSKPTDDEMYVVLKYGQVFPPIRSVCKSAWWKLEKEK